MVICKDHIENKGGRSREKFSPFQRLRQIIENVFNTTCRSCAHGGNLGSRCLIHSALRPFASVRVYFPASPSFLRQVCVLLKMLSECIPAACGPACSGISERTLKMVKIPYIWEIPCSSPQGSSIDFGLEQSTYRVDFRLVS